MAVLLSDSNFQTSWIAVDNKVDHASGMFNSQCSESAFLGARYQICGNDWGWGAQISQVYLEPWRPGARGVFFQSHDKDDQEWSHKTKVHEVKVQFEDGTSPAFWAIPKDAKDPKERCEFPTVSAEGLPDSEDFHTADHQAEMALGASPPALCEFISRRCPNVTMVGPNQSTKVRELEYVFCRGMKSTGHSAASLADHFSSGIARFCVASGRMAGAMVGHGVRGRFQQTTAHGGEGWVQTRFGLREHVLDILRHCRSKGRT